MWHIFLELKMIPSPAQKKVRLDIFFQCEKITILSNDFNGDVSKQSQPSCREADESQGGFARLGIPRAKLPCLIICCVLAKVWFKHLENNKLYFPRKGLSIYYVITFRGLENLSSIHHVVFSRSLYSWHEKTMLDTDVLVRRKGWQNPSMIVLLSFIAL